MKRDSEKLIKIFCWIALAISILVGIPYAFSNTNEYSVIVGIGIAVGGIVISAILYTFAEMSETLKDIKEMIEKRK